MNIPQNPVILLSFINTQLRDNYASLDDFCDSNDLSRIEIVTKLSSIDYEYDEEHNSFV